MQGGPSISICPIDWKSAIRIKFEDSFKCFNSAEKSGRYQDILARNTVFVFKKWEAPFEHFNECLVVVFFDLLEHNECNQTSFFAFFLHLGHTYFLSCLHCVIVDIVLK